MALRGKERVRPLVRFVCVPSEASRGSSNASRREAASVASDASIHASRALSHDQPGRSGLGSLRAVVHRTKRSPLGSSSERPPVSVASLARGSTLHVVPVWSAVDPPALGLALSPPRNHLPSLTCRQELRAMNEVYVGRRGLGGVDGAHASSTGASSASAMPTPTPTSAGDGPSDVTVAGSAEEKKHMRMRRLHPSNTRSTKNTKTTACGHGADGRRIDPPAACRPPSVCVDASTAAVSTRPHRICEKRKVHFVPGAGPADALWQHRNRRHDQRHGPETAALTTFTGSSPRRPVVASDRIWNRDIGPRRKIRDLSNGFGLAPRSSSPRPHTPPLPWAVSHDSASPGGKTHQKSSHSARKSHSYRPVHVGPSPQAG